MAEARIVDVFVEDRAHEEFLGRMVRRLAREESRRVDVRIRSARGGHGRAMDELHIYQEAARQHLGNLAIPDLLVVGIDANCKSHAVQQREIQRELFEEFRDRTAIACPDPHIERWYLADLASFQHIVGVQPGLPRHKCEKGFYKNLLDQAVTDAGHPRTLRGIEFAEELVNGMDLYEACRHDRSLKSFIDAARGLLRAL